MWLTVVPCGFKWTLCFPPVNWWFIVILNASDLWKLLPSEILNSFFAAPRFLWSDSSYCAILIKKLLHSWQRLKTNFLSCFIARCPSGDARATAAYFIKSAQIGIVHCVSLILSYFFSLVTWFTVVLYLNLDANPSLLPRVFSAIVHCHLPLAADCVFWLHFPAAGRLQLAPTYRRFHENV